MRVGISGLAADNAGGLGRLARSCIIALAQARLSETRPEWELHVYLRSRDALDLLREEAAGSADLLDRIAFHFAATGMRNRLVLEELSLPRQFRRLSLDCYLGLDFTLPPTPVATREAVVIPDLLPLTRPASVSPRARWLYRRGIRRAVKRGAELICISEHTRAKLAALFPEAAGRCTVVRPALSPRLAQLAEQSAEHDLALQVRGSCGSVTDPGRYLLYVGDFGARKNVATLVDVWRSMVEAGEYDGSLVLVGGDGRYGSSQRPTLTLQPVGPAPPELRDAPQVHDLGRVSDRDLSALYSSADLLVNLSLEEGFGYPVLEALAHGTPAVVTAGTAMEEAAPTGIVKTAPDPAAAQRTLVSALAALPILRQEVHALPAGWFKIDRMGEELAQVLESIG